MLVSAAAFEQEVLSHYLGWEEEQLIELTVATTGLEHHPLKTLNLFPLPPTSTSTSTWTWRKRRAEDLEQERVSRVAKLRFYTYEDLLEESSRGVSTQLNLASQVDIMELSDDDDDE